MTVTVCRALVLTFRVATSPADPDTDDDNDGGTFTDSLAPGERVPAQAGTHDRSEAPSAMGADVDNDNPKEHSNIHVGEFQWGTNPDDPQSTPSPELSVEVDYYAGADYQPLDTANWADGIEDNYALYGIDVTIIRDETLTDSDFLSCIPSTVQLYCIYPADGFGYYELYNIGFHHGLTGADEYVFVGHKAGGAIPNGENQSGVNLYGVPYQGLFVQGNRNLVGRVPASAIRASPYKTGLAFVAAKSEIHEIGHAFGLARSMTAASSRIRPGSSHGTAKCTAVAETTLQMNLSMTRRSGASWLRTGTAT